MSAMNVAFSIKFIRIVYVFVMMDPLLGNQVECVFWAKGKELKRGFINLGDDESDLMDEMMFMQMFEEGT